MNKRSVFRRRLTQAAVLVTTFLFSIQSGAFTADNVFAKQFSASGLHNDYQLQIGTPEQRLEHVKTRFGTISAPISDGSHKAYFLLRSYSSKHTNMFYDEKLYTYSTVRRTKIGELHVYLGTMYSSNNWLIYGLNVKGNDMVHWYFSELHALNILTGKDIVITKYHTEGGGYQFYTHSMGSIIYFMQGYPAERGVSFIIYSYNLEKKKIDILKNRPTSLKVLSQWTLMG